MTRAFMIGAPRSGSGKTMLTLGLQRAFRLLGRSVAGLKSGPDYIDPAFHAAATGRAGLNLDSWAMSPELIAGLAARAAAGADLIVAEASMGLFDGVPAPPGRSGASADIAALLGLPVILLVDVSGQAQSAAAVVKGCASYDPRLRVAGVVLNRVASPRHARLTRDAVEALGIPVLGCVPKLATLVLPERHLGLVQAEELPDLDKWLDVMAEAIASHVDLKALEALAAPLTPMAATPLRALKPPGKNIALARDAAFSFFYPHHLTSWREAGANLHYFSPLADEAPPEHCDVCWLPGGYPELHAEKLSQSRSFLGGLRRFAQTRPVHGECGGYMLLGASLAGADGVAHKMAGLLELETSFAARKLNLGYRIAELCVSGPLGRAGQRFKGHEFHYATIVKRGDDPPFAEVSDAYGAPPAYAGSKRGHVTGSFFHIVAEE